MNLRFILGIAIIIVAIIFASYSFTEANIEYMTFNEALHSSKKAQVKGDWIKEKPSEFDPIKNTFSFYMVDDKNIEYQVILIGAKPNNFEIAESVVAKGKFQGNIFYASNVLTKCPSKYEAGTEELNKTL
ncbi:MAG: cytochrome c maturation protein CcmE [Bacteroidetes bacterium]|nr:cytochrome c maturation protein CcmE [Bacteroidota bacterium]